MKSKLSELFWRIWWHLPFCRFNRKNHEKIVRNKFNYSKNSDMSIISANCIGGEIYSALGLEFRSPFINTSIGREDFIKLALCFREYMESSLEDIMLNDRNEFTAKLYNKCGDSITITFPHDHDSVKLVTNFERRKNKINYNKMYFITDDIGLSEKDIERFGKVQCTGKVILTAKDYSSKFNYVHQIKQDEKYKYVQRIQYKTLAGLFRFQFIWDYVTWFNKI